MFLIAGPCAIENKELTIETAGTLKEVCEQLGITLIFKSSFDKANRTTLSKRGVGMEQGLQILADIRSAYKVPVLTDVHESWQCPIVSQVADVLQIPAFLSRQTDLLQAAAKTGKVVNVKKGQFMAPWDMKGAIDKISAVSKAKHSDENTFPLNQRIWLTERGSSFGYGRLVVDMTSLVEMRQFGYPVIFDATHSVQQPSTALGVTGGNREMVPHLMRAALAVGVDGIFMEVHPNPGKAISDAANQVKLSEVKNILEQAVEYDLFGKSKRNI